jgi:serine/threonine-protein kinase
MGNESGRTPRPEYDPEHLPPGLEVGGWRILRRLDAGGYGVVYLVEHSGVRGALKMARRRASAAPPDLARTEERTERELICLLSIEHSNVVPVWAHGRYRDPLTGHLWFVMPFLEGDTLKVWSLRHAPTAREALRLFVKLADALEAAHRVGILHRDLKSDNILVQRKSREPFLLDFGVGHFPRAPPLTGEVLPPGTLTHRSPEALRFERENENNPQARYESQPTDDLYALGVTFYEVLTGTLPFRLPEGPGGPKRLALEIELRTPAPPDELNPQVPPLLSALVMRLLAKDPLERHASAEALKRDLASLDTQDAAWDVPLRLPTISRAAPREEQAPELAAPEPPLPAPRGRRAALGALAVVGALGLAGVAGFFLARDDSSPQPARPVATESRAPASVPPSKLPPAGEPAADASPMLNDAPRKEGPPVKTPPASNTSSAAPASAPPPKPVRASELRARCATLVVGSVAWLAAGCSSVPVRPEPAACPEDAIKAMDKEWRYIEGAEKKGPWPEAYYKEHAYVQVHLDIHFPSEWGACILRAGPVVGRVLDSNRTIIPRGTLLYGQAWTGDEKGGAVVRYTQAQLPDNRRFPVCLNAYNAHSNVNWYEGSKPGAPVVPCQTNAHPVRRFP